MAVIFTIKDIKEWLNNYKPEPGEFRSINNTSDEELMYYNFSRLVEYYAFKKDCVEAVAQFRKIFVPGKIYDNTKISEWCLLYEKLGSKELILFLIDCEPDEQHNTLKILGLDMLVELQPFMTLIIFCELFQVLYWDLQLHLPENEREFGEPGTYYYNPPDLVFPETSIKLILDKME